MFNTGLTEQEKESLIKYLCTKGCLSIQDGYLVVFKFDGPIYIEDESSPGYLLMKAFRNLSNQSRGVFK